MLAVDPGVKNVAVAAFQNRKLYHARLFRSKERLGSIPPLCDWAQREGFDELAIEIPQVRRNSPRAKDLIDLAFVAGAVWGAVACELVQYLPMQWKGNQPKEATQRRVSAALTPEEVQAIEMPTPYLQHNVWDAIGIGLKHLGRI